MTARPAGEPLGSRTQKPHNPDGWHTDQPLPPDQQGGRKRPPLRDNLPRDRGGTRVDVGGLIAITLLFGYVLAKLGAFGQWAL